MNVGVCGRAYDSCREIWDFSEICTGLTPFVQGGDFKIVCAVLKKYAVTLSLLFIKVNINQVENQRFWT